MWSWFELGSLAPLRKFWRWTAPFLRFVELVFYPRSKQELSSVFRETGHLREASIF